MHEFVSMGVRHFKALIAWQLADAFKLEVQQIVRESREASADLRYRGQLLDAAGAVSKDIAEGFLRHSAATFVRFLDYGLGSLVEAETRLQDGIERDYLAQSKCDEAFRLARRCLTATIRLKHSQWRYLREHGQKDRRK